MKIENRRTYCDFEIYNLDFQLHKIFKPIKNCCGLFHSYTILSIGHFYNILNFQTKMKTPDLVRSP